MFAGRQCSRAFFFSWANRQRVQAVFVFNEQWREQAIYPEDFNSYEWSIAVSAENIGLMLFFS